MALRLGDDVPIEYQADYERWKGEPVRAIIIPKKLFRQNGKGYPVLLRHHQNIILSLAHLEPYIVIEVSSKILELGTREKFKQNHFFFRWKKKIMPMKNFIFMPLILRKDFGQSEKILIQSLK